MLSCDTILKHHVTCAHWLLPFVVASDFPTSASSHLSGLGSIWRKQNPESVRAFSKVSLKVWGREAISL